MRWETEVLILAERDRVSLAQRAKWLAEWCAAHPSTSLKDLAFTLNSDFDSSPLRLSLVATSINDLEGKLRFAATRLSDAACQQINDRSGIYYYDKPPGYRAKVAFLFPGEGAQYPNMLADLCISFPEARSCFDMLDRALQGQCPRPSRFIFPSSHSDANPEGNGDQLWQMNGAVEAVLTANRALFAVLEELQIFPDAVVGHSTGEYNALLAAGAIRIDDEQQIIASVRAGNSLSERLLSEGHVAAGALLAVGPADESLIRSTLENMNGSLWLAMDNCPHQVVLFGSEEAIEQTSNNLRLTGAVCQRLPFSRAYHTPLFAPIRVELEDLFSTLNFCSPRIQVYSCATARPYPPDPESIRKIVLDQWTTCVNFRETVLNMYDDGISAFIEVGPRGNLSSFVKDILRGKPHVAIPANLPSRNGITQLNHLVARLAANHIPVRPGYLHKRRNPQRISFEKEATTKTSTASRVLALTLPLIDGFAVTPPEVSANGNRTKTVEQQSGVEPPKSIAMRQYFQTMGRFLEIQQNVMKTFLAHRLESESHGVAVSESHAEPTEAPPDEEQGERVPEAAEFQPVSESGPNSVDTQAHQSVAAMLLEIVVDKTGYPREMLDLSASLEADLGIDSIKRVEIIGTLQRKTKVFSSSDIESASRLKTLGQIIDLATSCLTVAEPSPDLCFIETLEVLEPGKMARATKVFDLNRDRFLRDHSLGGRVSARDMDLFALVVIPLTISLECLAQLASLLASDKSLLAIREVNATRWIALKQSHVTVQISAEVSPNSPAEIYAKLTDQAGHVAAVEAVFVFGDRRERTMPRNFTLRNPVSSSRTSEELYSEVMFHGPAFQGVTSLDTLGSDGISATLRVPTGQSLTSKASLLTTPFLLDAVGQLVGFWTEQTFSERYVVFPFYIKSIEFFGEPPVVGSQLTGRARMDSVTDAEVRSDFEVIDADELLRVRVEGWKDKRIDMPDEFFRFRMSPLRERMSQAWPSALANLPEGRELACFRLSLNDSLLRAESGIWLSVLAHLVLNRNELLRWESLTATEKRRTEWLLGRVVAKDTARSFAREQWGIDLYPADIEISSDEFGKPFINWCDESGRMSAISLAHSDGVAVALVGDSARWNGIGIDIEPLGYSRPDFEDVAFTDDERSLLSGLGTALREENSLRLWCAKEAAAKALGRGILGTPMSLVAQSLDAHTGAVTLKPSKEMVQQLGNAYDGTQLTAFTARDGNFIVASSLIARKDKDTQTQCELERNAPFPLKQKPDKPAI